MAARLRPLAAPLLFACLAVAIASAGALPTAAWGPSGPEEAAACQEPAPATTPVEALVVDREGRFVEGLRPSDFAVTVDGRRRAVLSVKRVSRGPGAAADAASRQVGADAASLYAAEPRRNVVIVFDEAAMLKGDERLAVRAADAFLERLGYDDLIGVIRIPTPADSTLTLTTERPPVREALSTVIGQLSAANVAAQAATPPFGPSGMSQPNKDPNTGMDLPSDRPVRAGASELPYGSTEEDVTNARSALLALRDLMVSLQRLPGRKVVLLFSAGLLAPSQSRVEEATVAAAAARATIYAFGMRVEPNALRRQPDVGPIQTLARATGGSFEMLGRNPARAVERAIADLSACYVLGLQAEPSDADGGRHRVRVESSRTGLTARSGTWLPASPPPDDVSVAPRPAPAAAEPADAPPGGVDTTTASPPSRAVSPRPLLAPPSREAKLELALARLFEYADAYERQYSMLVAEEEYTQIYERKHAVTRSDLMLVNPAGRWVSFRDVFEVDGRQLRDREDRLRRLFLDPQPEAQARLQSVMDESTKYNIGPVVRSINVPLFPLDILRSWNRSRFEFKLGRDTDADGLRAWRIEYTERARPTIVEGLEGEDIPIRGFFVIDQLTGAIIETTVLIAKGPVNGEIVVRYARDKALGLRVPLQMRERYLQGRQILMEGRADYSKFRRFQVKTEENVTLPVK